MVSAIYPSIYHQSQNGQTTLLPVKHRVCMLSVSRVKCSNNECLQKRLDGAGEYEYDTCVLGGGGLGLC